MPGAQGTTTYSPYRHQGLARYFYHHGRFIASHPAPILAVTLACMALLLLPPFFRLASAVWARGEFPYTFTPISSYLHNAPFFGKVGTDPMLVWQTVTIQPDLPWSTITSSAPLLHQFQQGPNLLTQQALIYTWEWEHLVHNTHVTLEEIQQTMASKGSLGYPTSQFSHQSRALPGVTATTTYGLQDICYQPGGRLTPGLSPCLVLSPLLYWDQDLSKLREEPDVEATVRRQAASPIRVHDIPVQPEMIFSHLQISPSLSAGPVTTDGFLTSLVLVERWQAPVPVQAILHTILQKATRELNQETAAGCATPLDTDYLPCPPTVTLTFNSTDRVFRAHFQSNYSKFSVEHYCLVTVCFGLFAYSFYTLYRLDMVKSKFWLGFATVLMLVCSLFLALSVCTWLVTPHPLLPWEMLPFFVVVIGVENAHAVTQSMANVPLEYSIKERVGQGLARVGPTMLVRLCVEVTVLMLGMVWTPAVVQEFCTILILTIVIDYGLHMTFFVTVLSIDIRRLELADIYRQRTVPSQTIPLAPTDDPFVGHDGRPALTVTGRGDSFSDSIHLVGGTKPSSDHPLSPLRNIIKTPTQVFRYLHRVSLHQRIYSLLLTMALVGLLSYFYHHTSHAVNLILPPQDYSFLSNVLLPNSAGMLESIMHNFNSLEILGVIRAGFSLDGDRYTGFLQSGSDLTPSSTATLWGIGLVRWGWLCVGLIALAILVRVLVRGPTVMPLSVPWWRLISPITFQRGSWIGTRQGKCRIQYTDIHDVDLGLTTDVGILRSTVHQQLLAIAHDGQGVVVPSTAFTAQQPNPRAILSRWRMVTNPDSLLQVHAHAHTHRTQLVTGTLRGQPGHYTNLITDDLQQWMVARETGTPHSLSLWRITPDGLHRVHRWTIPYGERVTCLALAHLVTYDDHWSLWSYPPNAVEHSPFITIMLGFADGRVQLVNLSAVEAQPRAENPEQVTRQVTVITLEAERSVQFLYAVDNVLVCGQNGNNVQVLQLTFGLPQWSVTWRWLYAFTENTDGFVTQLGYHPACPRLLATGTQWGSVKLWDLATGRRLAVLSSGRVPTVIKNGSMKPPHSINGITTFTWPPIPVDATVDQPTPTPANNMFQVPSPANALASEEDERRPMLGSQRHTRDITRILVYPDQNALHRIERVLVVTASLDETVQIWQVKLEDYTLPHSLASPIVEGHPLPYRGQNLDGVQSEQTSPRLPPRRNSPQTSGTSTPPTSSNLSLLQPLSPLTTNGSPSGSSQPPEGRVVLPGLVTGIPRSRRRKSWHRERVGSGLASGLINTGATVPEGTSDPAAVVLHLLSVYQPGCTTIAHYGTCLVGVRRTTELGTVLDSEALGPTGQGPNVESKPAWRHWWHIIQRRSAPVTAKTLGAIGPSDDHPHPPVHHKDWSLWVVYLNELRTSDEDPRKRALDHSFATHVLPLSPSSFLQDSPWLPTLIPGVPTDPAIPLTALANPYTAQSSGVVLRRRRTTPGPRTVSGSGLPGTSEPVLATGESCPLESATANATYAPSNHESVHTPLPQRCTTTNTRGLGTFVPDNLLPFTTVHCIAVQQPKPTSPILSNRDHSSGIISSSLLRTQQPHSTKVYLGIGNFVKSIPIDL
ncbi:hypothetical protein IWQ61_000452 [Dispira simplex]|nr:hypothetical protein IWQ61_000452 [Dispira simplex]